MDNSYAMLHPYSSNHCHSDRSNIRLLDSINKVDKMIETAISLGLKGIAITDHEALSSHVKAELHLNGIKNKPKDFKLMYGNEIYLVRNGLTKENYVSGQDKYYHFILIAKDRIGYRQLCELSTRSWSRSYYQFLERVPTYYSDIEEVIGKNPGHVVATTACIGGFLGMKSLEYLSTQNQKIRSEIIDFLEWGRKIFNDDFYIEMQPSFQEDQISFNKLAKNIAEDLNIKTVVATDAHYLRPEDRPIHEAYLNSKDGEREVADFYATTYLMTSEEVYEYMKDYIDINYMNYMFDNTVEIANKCENYSLKHAQIIPLIDIPKEKFWDSNWKRIDNFGDYEYIKKMIESEHEIDRYYINMIAKGFCDKILLEDRETTLKRINQELEEIWEISLKINDQISAYFVTAADVIETMWNEGDSLVGPSRGSAMCFVTNYLLNITQLNPLKQDIEVPHWRFIHKDRPELPDIDIDSQAAKRSKIFNAIKEKAKRRGGDAVNIITFGTEGSKSAVQTACRGLGIDNDIGIYLASLIPVERGFNWSLSDCLYGNEEKERKAIKQFIDEIGKYDRLLEVAVGIEGLVKQRSIHASGVIITNEELWQYNAVMKAPNGTLVTQFDLNDTEYMGGLKFDFLTVEAEDKLRKTLDLLVEYNHIQWQGSLKATYDKYLHPDALTENDEIWRMAANGSVHSLFQFDTPVGGVAIRKTKPNSVAEMSVANSAMRLMGDGSGDMPVDIYARYKQDIKLWYKEMENFGLTVEEREVLKKHLLPLSGVADSQESVMLMSMDKNISGFTVTEANKLRKAIAKKKYDVMQEAREMFFRKGKECGASDKLLHYVWDVQIKRQLGYSFSTPHTLAYSWIALQELNLCYNYPIIYWNTACLAVDAGALEDEEDNEEDDGAGSQSYDDNGIGNSDIGDQDDVESDEDESDGPTETSKKKSKNTNYGKVATAIGKMQSAGIKVSLPDINRAHFSFIPVEETNEILFGLKGITRVGDSIVDNIISSRPYESVEDFIKKVKVNKTQMLNLIKAGCFDSLGDRVDIMKEYITIVSEPKKRITLQNMNMLIEKDLIPEELSFEVRVFRYNKYLKKYCKSGNDFDISDSTVLQFFEENFDRGLIEYTLDGKCLVDQKLFDKKIYQVYMDNVRTWMKATPDLLDQLNQKLFDETWNKYCLGSLAKWEMDALSFYYTEHELNNVDEDKYHIVHFNNLPKEPQREPAANAWEQKYPKFKLCRIVGTVLDKNKARHMVTLLTPDGVVDVKLYRSQFAKYDKQISIKDPETGKKKIIEKSWFSRGNKLLVSGMRREDQFIPKIYKNHFLEAPLFLVEDINNEGLILRSERALDE